MQARTDGVATVILYGSRARGDYDRASGRDICLVFDDIPFAPVELSPREELSSLVPEAANVTIYSRTEFATMVRNGSLFAWHLKLEGQIIFAQDSTIQSIFQEIGPYQRAPSDIQSYQGLTNDVADSLRRSRVVSIFDLAMLFTIARNTAMVLSFLGGRPAFGRTSVFDVSHALFGHRFAFRPDLYRRLLRWKLWYVRGLLPSEWIPSKDEAMVMLDHVRNLTDFALKEADT